MMGLHPSLTGRERRTLTEIYDFLCSSGVGDRDLAIGPQGEIESDAWLHVEYATRDLENWHSQGVKSFSCELCIRNLPDHLAIVSGLSSIEDIILALTLSDLKQSVALINPRQSIAEVNSRLDIYDDAFIKPEIAGWAMGHFLSPEGDRYTNYYVDTHGEIRLLARSSTIAAEIVFYAAINVFEREQLLNDFIAHRNSKSSAGARDVLKAKSKTSSRLTIK